MPRTLLIVESPTKAKKLRQFLGREFQIAASFGHLRDLPRSGDLAVSFGDDGSVRPRYEPTERAAKTIAELRRLAAAADLILLATDPDREGEAIAWHVQEVLPADRNYQRVTFNAITEAAVRRALAAPRQLDHALIGAQQARRVLDRVVGWVVSPTLRRGLGKREARSAGRVQSVALRLVCEREREIQAFTAVDFFTLQALLLAPAKPPAFTAELVQWKGEALAHRLAEAATAEATVTWCKRQRFVVDAVERRDSRRQPPPPFITASVQQAASVQLKLDPKRCMQLLQELFENGHITYHRTDSTAVDPEAIAAARAIIEKEYGAEYLPPRPVEHRSTKATSQEAHEAIRPTHPETGPRACGSGEAGNLYDLIWRRFISSQMAAGLDFLTDIRVAVAPDSFTHPEHGRGPMGIFEAKGKVVRFDGWRRLSDDAGEPRSAKSKKKEDPELILPDVEVGSELRLEKLQASKKTTKAPPRYTQASLIKKLEQAGIGRPSTYASILSTLLDRHYISQRQRTLQAEELGMQITDWLCRHFRDNFIDVGFTAALEAELDAIARGEHDWQAAVRRAAESVVALARAAGLPYNPLAGESPPDPGAVDPAAGACPRCGGGMARRHGRYGAFFACLDRSCGATRGVDPDRGRPGRGRGRR